MPVQPGTVGEALTDAAKDGLTDLLIGYVRDGFEDFGYASTDLPNFIADTSPVVAAAQPTRQIGRLACRSYARGFGPQNLPGFDAAWAGICGPYLESIGEAPDPGSIAPPFQGGQCYGVQYNGNYTFRNPNGGQLQTSTFSFVARVIGLGEVDNGNGTKSGGVRRQSSPGGPITFVPLGTTLSNLPLDQSISNITISGPGQDNCGNPPVVYDPPKVKPSLPSVPTTPVDLPGIGPVGVDVTFAPDGTLTVNLPDVGIEVPIEVPIGVEIGGGGGSGGGGASPPGDVGQPSAPVSVSGSAEEEGEAPAGSVLTGLRVQIVAFPDSRNKYTQEVYRGAYYAYMGTPGLLDLDLGGAMVRLDQFLLAEKENLTAWRVYANTGYELVVTPYYREVEA